MEKEYDNPIRVMISTVDETTAATRGENKHGKEIGRRRRRRREEEENDGS